MSNQEVDRLWNVNNKKFYQEKTMKILTPKLLTTISDVVASQPSFLS